MKISLENTLWWLFASFTMGALLAISSFVWADDTTDVPYEVISTRDTLILEDSIVIIHTVCAPICSSHVRVYNKEWQYLGVLKAPFKSAFPEAYIENNKLLWRDNDTFDYTPTP